MKAYTAEKQDYNSKKLSVKYFIREIRQKFYKY